MTERLIVGSIAAGLGIAFPLLATAAAEAPLVWREPTILSDHRNQSNGPQVAVDSNGNAVAAWEEGPFLRPMVRAAFRPAGGRWEPAVTLGDGGGVRVALDRDGTAIAVWRTGTSLVTGGVRAAVRPGGGPWGAPRDLAPEPAACHQLVADPAGNVAVVWTGNRRVRLTALSPDRTWRPAHDLGELPTDCPTIAIDSNENALAIWTRSSGSVEAAGARAGDTLGPIETLSGPVDGFVSGGPQAAFDRDGNAVAVWPRLGTRPSVQTADRPAGESFGPPQTVSRPGTSADLPVLAANAAGNAIVVWRVFGDGGPKYEASFRVSAGAGWGATEEVVGPPSGAFGRHDAAMDARGGVIVVWSKSQFMIEAAARPPEGPFGPVEDVSQRGVDSLEPQVAVDAAGRSVAVWRIRRGGSNRWLASGTIAASLRPCPLGPCTTEARRSSGRARLRRTGR